MLTLRGISYAIARRTLLKDINWTLQPGRRLALVGPNGAGKTTLLRVIAGELEPDIGRVIRSRNYRVGHLPQETIICDQGNLIDSVLGGRPDIRDMEARLEALRATPPEGEKEHLRWEKQVDDLETRFSSLNGYEVENHARRILSGLGFERDWEDRSLEEFSGGWRMRALLAKLLLGEPDLLLLDEPTNHLDLPSLEWLEKFLLGFNGAMVMVSHDRFFVDRLAQEIVELENGRLFHYPGRFRKYLELREETRERALIQIKRRESERRKQERFIERFRYKATKAAQVQSRIKQLEKMEIQESPPETTAEMNFRLTLARSPYRDVLTAKNLGFAYSRGQWVFRDLNLELERGDKVCLVGRNGEGKTTLTRLISGDLSPLEGQLKKGQNVSIGYYAQHQVDALNLNRRVIDEVGDAASLAQTPMVRSILGLFGFQGDDVFKTIDVLSGGEKARVSLARILLSGANFLIMDEPTNHLDAYARDALEKALLAYEGTVMLVSHDRYFLDGIVNRVLEMRDGTLTPYLGNYSEYLENRDTAGVEEKPLPPKDSAGGRREQRRIEAQARQAVSKQRNRLSARIDELENLIETLEHRQAQLDSLLAQPETYEQSETVVSLQKEYAQVGSRLNRSVSEWESLHHELDSLMESLQDSSTQRGDP